VTTDFDGRAYQARFDALAHAGADVHGEADFVRSFTPRSVLDAGCGTGRVAIELARRGIRVVGVDISVSMIDEARRRAPELDWYDADLADLDLGQTFDVVVMAGNVPLFCPAGQRPALVHACATHVVAGGVLVAGFRLDGEYGTDEYDLCCAAAGLVLEERYATWDREPFRVGCGYAVSVHSRR